jgi:nitrogen fixation NifU-like protein
VTGLESFHQEIILEHYRRPLHAGLREPFDAQVHHVNPDGEDEVTVRVTLNDAGSEPVLADVSYRALGCSISVASVSVMADIIIGKTVREATDISEAFLNLMLSRGNTEPDEDMLGDAVAFASLSKYPSRIKCVLLGWMAWKDATTRALSQQDETPAANRAPGVREHQP